MTFFFLVGFLSHTAPPEEKLSPDDAQFVDVIHSAGLWMGTDEKVYNIKYPSIVPNLFFSSIFVFFCKKVGQVDFYPNGGQAHQPGCENEDALGLPCSHARAPVSSLLILFKTIFFVPLPFVRHKKLPIITG